MAESLENTYRGLLETAAFAARAHRGQFRKDKETPYVSHVFRVCLVAREIFGIRDPRVRMPALLHDTVEDTTTDFDDLEERFGREIAEWVAFLSKDKRLREPEREQAYIDNLARAPWQVLVCKLADIFDNLMDLGQLPSDRVPQTLSRMEYYLNALRKNTDENLRRPLALVTQLLLEIKTAGPFNELFAAVEEGNIEKVRYCIDAGMNVNERDSHPLIGNGNTPLHDVRNAEIAKLLSQAGADVNARCQDGWTPLMRACNQGNLAVVMVLL